MAKLDKLIEKIMSIMSSNRGLRFEELAKVLKAIGYTIHPSGSGGSHYVFRKPGRMPITIPKDYPINKAYIK